MVLILAMIYDVNIFTAKVVFTQRYALQNFGSRVLYLVNNCVESIYKTQ